MCLCVLKHTPHFPVASTFHSSSEGDDGPLDTRQVQRRFIMEACHGEIIISGHNYRYNILKLYIKWWIMFWTWSLHDHVLFFFRCSAPTANTRWTESIRNLHWHPVFVYLHLKHFQSPWAFFDALSFSVQSEMSRSSASSWTFPVVASLGLNPHLVLLQVVQLTEYGSEWTCFSSDTRQTLISEVRLML